MNDILSVIPLGGLEEIGMNMTVLEYGDDMVVIGRAMTILEGDVFTEVEGSGANPVVVKPFGLTFEALDDMKPGEVWISTGSSPTYARWGGLMTVRAMHLGVAGSVLNGYARDAREILRLGYPCF